MDLLPPLRVRIFPVGRLDYKSEGLLLMTNDGELSHRLMHPSLRIKKVYQVRLKGSLDSAQLEKLKRGVYLDGKKAVPDYIRPIKTQRNLSWLNVEMHEGRYREIRRMFAAVGCRVLQLKRLRFGGLSLGRLKTGQWRRLTPSEVRRLEDEAGLTGRPVLGVHRK